MNTTLGRVQNGILIFLKWASATPTTLARHIYGIKRDELPTKSQVASVRQTLRQLERDDVVRLTKFIHERERCWELTGKVVPARKEKSQAARKPLAVVK